MSNAAQQFYCGNHAAVLKILGKAPLFKSKHTSDWPYQVGSLVFTGELLEAITLYQLALQQKNSERSEFTEARFFIGIGLVRTSRYVEASKYFALSLNEYRKLRKKTSNSWKEAFFAYQGAAFFRFFHGRFNVSRKMAEKAYQAAFEGNYLFGQAFASELMGHCNCQLGEVHKGIKDLDRAIEFAESLGNGGLNSAFQIAREKFKAQYGVDLKNTEKHLYKALRTLKPEDTYSKAELYLELSRQLILRGKVSKAKELLDENAESIYKHQNRRQSAIFNLRYSYILYIQGESKAALTLLRSCKGNLVKKIDRYYLNQLEGLESKITSELENKIVHSASKNKFFNFVDERIYARSHKTNSIEIKTKEDSVGDFIDAALQQSIDIVDLEKSGLFGLAPLLLKQKLSSSFLLIGPMRGQLIAYSKGDLNWIPEGITQPMVKILTLLEGGRTVSKEDIVKDVWGYEYRPDRHDNLLQATIAKLRKNLGSFYNWIEWGSGGYSLNADVKLLYNSLSHNAESKNIFEVHSSTPPKEEKTKITNAPAINSSDLNHRQIKLIKLLKDGSFIGVSDYAKQFKTCKMTACRDLTLLLKRNILQKSGRARATQYYLRGIENEI